VNTRLYNALQEVKRLRRDKGLPLGKAKVEAAIAYGVTVTEIDTAIKEEQEKERELLKNL